MKRLGAPASRRRIVASPRGRRQDAGGHIGALPSGRGAGVPPAGPGLTAEAPVLRPLPRKFFARPPERVAPDLIGQLLVRETGGNQRGRYVAGRIVEVEAYQGQSDPAAHAFRGPTARNATLFGPPGHAYVYTSYGLHQCLNVSTEPPGKAGCVLIRALELWCPGPAARRWVERQALSARRPGRGPRQALNARRLLSGPGRLCRALAIPRAMDGWDLTVAGPLWLAGGAAPRRIAVTRRVGIHQAAERPLRFYDLDSPAISAGRGPVVALLAGRRGRWGIV